MREVWIMLPSDSKLIDTGVDWLQVLLHTCQGDTRAKILLSLWKAWHLRDDVIHDTGKETVTRPAAFWTK